MFHPIPFSFIFVNLFNWYKITKKIEKYNTPISYLFNVPVSIHCDSHSTAIHSLLSCLIYQHISYSQPIANHTKTIPAYAKTSWATRHLKTLTTQLFITTTKKNIETLLTVPCEWNPSVTGSAYKGKWCGKPLLWHHNGRDSVSNQQPHHCLPNRLFGWRSKKTSKLRVTCLCVGNTPVPGELPAQMASNAENMFPFDDVIMVSFSWRYQDMGANSIPLIILHPINYANGLSLFFCSQSCISSQFTRALQGYSTGDW